MSSGGRQTALGERYAGHNRARGRGFIYGGAERTEALRAFLRIPDDGLVLDLGCRDGSLAEALGLPGDRTVGADIDAEALAAAGAAGAESPCRADLWGGFPFRDGAFAAAVAGEIVEHVPFPQEFVAEVARVLRPGGTVVGSVPNAFRLTEPPRLRVRTVVRGRSDAPASVLAARPCATCWNIDFTHVRDHIRASAASRGVWPRMFGNDLVWTGVKA